VESRKKGISAALAFGCPRFPPRGPDRPKADPERRRRNETNLTNDGNSASWHGFWQSGRAWVGGWGPDAGAKPMPGRPNDNAPPNFRVMPPPRAPEGVGHDNAQLSRTLLQKERKFVRARPRTHPPTRFVYPDEIIDLEYQRYDGRKWGENGVRMERSVRMADRRTVSLSR